MEKIVEILLMIFWDSIKALILQWIIEKAKELWATLKNSSSLQYA
jgi:hypothetical protein